MLSLCALMIPMCKLLNYNSSYLSTAKIFWKENKMEKFTRWIEKSILLNPRLGDAWAYLFL